MLPFGYMMSEDELDAVFHALASRARRRILDILKSHPGICVGDVSDQFEVSRIQILKHLRVLEDAGLVASRKVGRVRQLHLNAVPLQVIHDRWTTDFSSHWAHQLLRLKHRIESKEEKGHGRD